MTDCAVHGMTDDFGRNLRARHPATLMQIFAGSQTNKFDRLDTYPWPAVSSQGLCAYYQLLQDPNLSPEDASRIVLLPGCIEHNEVRYKAVEDLTRDDDREELFWSRFVTRSDDRIDFIVQETANSERISGAYYRIQSNKTQVRNSISTYSQFFACGELMPNIKPV